MTQCVKYSETRRHRGPWQNVLVSAREKLIEGTLALIATGGFSAVTVASVARQSDVSRQTVYTLFGSKEALVSEAVGTVALGVLGVISDHASATDTPLDYLVEFAVAAVTEVRRDAVLTTLLFANEGNPIFMRETVLRATPIARELLAPMFDKYPQLTEKSDRVVELVVRLGISVIMFDSEAVRDDEGLRAFLRPPLASIL
ncbi:MULTISPECIES: TetR/AcrR family transcriptional regulator [unclassified Rhodococcus (in: high G+C Gram-positive bacteria)]|uniref:TetR/AcrR family transcriptional regulator n=1 Tax=unclassified Rhodococcus (in: high G+C Gram-positive bacteria) TaxID=192944 RepID=UPI0009E7A613|nr:MULTISPECIES: TetR/AcrR family transcriptional regulator [unclassified Rhodococcus (in: high G+C Gram-positive bacteria)]